MSWREICFLSGMSKNTQLPELSLETVAQSILHIRGQKVMLDAHLAALYDVPAKVLNQAVRRNAERFPIDFMFQLTENESSSLRSQIVTLEMTGRGKYSKYLPHVFTEQGVAMLSSVLRSPRAIAVNIEIMRAFVKLKQLMASNHELARKLASLENKYDSQFKVVFDAIRQLMVAPNPSRHKIGFLGKPQ